jgi:hypothetical protein
MAKTGVFKATNFGCKVRRNRRTFKVLSYGENRRTLYPQTVAIGYGEKTEVLYSHKLWLSNFRQTPSPPFSFEKAVFSPLLGQIFPKIGHFP